MLILATESSIAGWRSILGHSAGHSCDPFGHVPELLARLHQGRPGTQLLHVRTMAPTVAFSRRDSLQPGFSQASAAAQSHGFEVAIRPVGGSFAPVHFGSLIVDHYGVSVPDLVAPRRRFLAHSAALTSAFADLGVKARVGAVEGEYCPGEFSVSSLGGTKLSGTAQRISRDAWLVSTIIQVGDPAPLADVTSDCARALGQLVDPAKTGSISNEVLRNGALERRSVFSDLAIVATHVADTFRKYGLVNAGSVYGLANLRAGSFP